MIKKLLVDKMIRERENEISMMLLDNEVLCQIVLVDNKFDKIIDGKG